MLRRDLLVLLVLLLLPLDAALAPSAARADSIWEKAKRPAEKLSADEIHKTAANLYHRARPYKLEDPQKGGMSYSALLGALSLLQAHGASTSADPRLRYDLGLVLAKMRRWGEAAPALESALALSPQHPFAEEGSFELAICYSHLGRHEDEERAYLVALGVTDRRGNKALICSNLAESRMAQGKLAAALDAAEQALELDPDLASARYNQAIILDRAGDPSGALEAAKHALELDPDADSLVRDGVFFEPAYEKHWYVALRELALAERTLGDVRKFHLMAALTFYDKWLAEADAGDRFRPRALEAVARLEKQLKLKPAVKAKK
ncbi:MAG: tetratricopeptide repeat protein [Deltaproteobacteria bacterium]|nr:tetratricopeptide repeat protein [Deltaproteobacteria bacterium]